MVDSPKRWERVFQDLAARPVTPSSTTNVITTERRVMRNWMVLTVAANNNIAMMVTPAREIVMTSATNAKGMATAHRYLRPLGNREVSAVTSSGVIVHNRTERLFDSINVPGTR